MDTIFQCPCEAGRKLGEKILALQIVGLADTVLYRTVVLMEDPREPLNKMTGRRTQYGIMPCRKECSPPPKGVIPTFNAALAQKEPRQ